MDNIKIVSNNKKAFHEYSILETYQAGLVLTGTEIKSIRSGKANLKDSYAKVEKGEVWIYKMHISPYEMGNIYNHDPERKRKLLLNKKEITKLTNKMKESGLAIVPTKLYLLEGWAKIEVGVGKGKKLHDKRDTIAKKTVQREIDRAMKSNNNNNNK